MKIIETNLKFKRGLRVRTVTKRIIIHHAASAGDVSAATIHQWHLDRGWIGCGYHYVIRFDGTIERGRPEHVIGSHAGPTANGDSIGICLTGHLTKHDPTEAQVSALVWLIRDIYRRYGELEIVGHEEIMPTDCPGKRFPWARIRQMLKGDVAVTMFKDIVNHWAKGDIEWLAKRGLLARAENFRPNDAITRAETAVLIKRAVEYVLKEVQK